MILSDRRLMLYRHYLQTVLTVTAMQRAEAQPGPFDPKRATRAKLLRRAGVMIPTRTTSQTTIIGGTTARTTIKSTTGKITIMTRTTSRTIGVTTGHLMTIMITMRQPGETPITVLPTTRMTLLKATGSAPYAHGNDPAESPLRLLEIMSRGNTRP